MKKLRIGIIDIVSRGPTRALYARIMNASLASVMPQIFETGVTNEGNVMSLLFAPDPYDLGHDTGEAGVHDACV